MVKTCAAINCTNRFVKGSGITFHRFPQKKELREQWIKSIRRKNFTPSDYSTICSEHFEAGAFDRTSCVVVRLKNDAVPTIFKGLPSYLQKRPNCFSCCKKQDRKKKLAEDYVKRPTRSLYPKKGSRRKELVDDALQRLTCYPCRKTRSRTKELADDFLKEQTRIPSAKKQGRKKEHSDDANQNKSEEAEQSVKELKGSKRQTQEGSLQGKKSSEYILPERGTYCHTNETSTKYLHLRTESRPFLIISSTASSISGSNCVSSNKTYIRPKHLTFGTSVNSSRTSRVHGRLWNSTYLRSIVGNDHIYSNTLSSAALKQKLDSVCDSLNDVNKKLEIEEEKYRQSEKTIARLKRIIEKLKS